MLDDIEAQVGKINAYAIMPLKKKARKKSGK